MAENLAKKFKDYIKDVRNDEIKSIVIGLIALIGLLFLSIQYLLALQESL